MIKKKSNKMYCKIIRVCYHLQQKEDVWYMNIKKKMLVLRRILKSMVYFFTITSGNILCWVLVLSMLDRYHAAIIHV